MDTINVFTNIEPVPDPIEYDTSNLDQVDQIEVGVGSETFKVDQSGMWLGATQFADAPFSVDMNGNVIASSLTATGYIEVGGAAGDVNGNVTKIQGGKISASELDVITAQTGTLYVGSGQEIILDGDNSNIKLNDGSDDRVIIDGANGRFRVSKSGQDVDVPGTDGVNLIMSSEYNLFKIVEVVTGSITVNNGAGEHFEDTYTHNLGYVPMAIGGINWDDGTSYRFPIPYMIHADDGGDGVIRYMVNFGLVSTTQIEVWVDRDATTDAAQASHTVYYTIYLLRETF